MFCKKAKTKIPKKNVVTHEMYSLYHRKENDIFQRKRKIKDSKIM